MGELKQDFNNGKISKEKYDGLLESYDNKLKNINATLRLRKMQGLTEEENDSDNQETDRIGLNPKKGYFADDYVVREGNNEKTIHKTKNSSKYIVIAITFLIIAFIAGATSGFFNYYQQTNTQQNNSQPDVHSIQINEDAFPPTIDNENQVSTTKTSDYYSSTDENNVGYDNHDSESNSDSGFTTENNVGYDNHDSESNSDSGSTDENTGDQDNPDPESNPDSEP